MEKKNSCSQHPGFLPLETMGLLCTLNLWCCIPAQSPELLLITAPLLACTWFTSGGCSTLACPLHKNPPAGAEQQSQWQASCSCSLTGTGVQEAILLPRRTTMERPSGDAPVQLSTFLPTSSCRRWRPNTDDYSCRHTLWTLRPSN